MHGMAPGHTTIPGTITGTVADAAEVTAEACRDMAAAAMAARWRHGTVPLVGTVVPVVGTTTLSVHAVRLANGRKAAQRRARCVAGL